MREKLHRDNFKEKLSAEGYGTTPQRALKLLVALVLRESSVRG
jgi:hypothetical protein